MAQMALTAVEMTLKAGVCNIFSHTRTFRQKGFTLVEILLVMAIMGLMITISVAGTSYYGTASLKESSSKIAARVKQLYERAMLEQKHIRLVFDIEKNVYYAEETQEYFALENEKLTQEETLQNEQEKQEMKKTFDEDSASELLSEYEKIKQKYLLGPAFAKIEGELGEEVSLSGDTKFLRIWIEHQSEPYEAGLTYLHFFPTGFTERAVMHLKNDEEVFTIKIEPLTGRTKVYNEELTIDTEPRQELP